MRLAARSVRDTRQGRIAAVLLLAVLIALLGGRPPSVLAADIMGTITPGDSPVTVTISTAGDNAALTFTGTQNQRISVNLSLVSIGTSACCSAKASIRKPDGTNLVAPQFFGTVGGFLDTVSLPSSGTYTIYIDPQGTSTGSVTVTAYDVPADVSGATNGIGGGKTEVTLATPGQNGRWTFDGQAGQVVRLATSEVSIAGSGCCSARASIEGPGGTTLGSSQFFGTVDTSLVRTLIHTGTHSIFINPVDAFTGAAKLQLSIAGRSPAAGGIVRTTYPTFRVDPPANPNTEYFYEIATDSGFSNIVEASGALPTTNTFRPSVRLENDTTYYWRWKTTPTAWSAGTSFTTKEKMFGTREEWPMWSKGPLAVNKVTGNLVLALPGPSYPTAVGSMGASLTYNSLDTKDHVGLGPGWTLNAGPDLSAAPKSLHDLSLLGEEEKMEAAEVYFADGDSAFYGRVGQTNTYIGEPGDGSLLSKNDDGTWTLVEGDGIVYTFKKADEYGVTKLDSVEFVDAGPGKGKLTYSFVGTKIESITDGAGRQLRFKWSASACPNAILCIEGPDAVTWRYIGATGEGRTGWLMKVNNGTRDVAEVEYDVVGQVYKLRNANDLDPSSASPGYNPDHEITIAYCCGTSNRKVMWISDGFITLADGGSQSATTWFEYSCGGAAPAPTRAAHGTMPAGTVRAGAGCATVQPPRQHGAQNPKLIKSWHKGGREIQTTDILGNVTMAEYDARGNLLWTEDEEGNPTDYSWDTVDDVLLSTTGPDPDGTGPLGRPVTTNRYDEQQIGTASTPGTVLQGLQASLYENISLASRAKVRRTDPAVDFDWGAGGPPGNTATDNFSIRWTGNLIVPSQGSYTFSTNADDGTRLTVGKAALIDNMIEQPATVVSSRPVTLTAGSHKIVLDYYDKSGPAEVELRWSCTGCLPAIPQQVVPSSALRPGWLNQTSTVSPLGKVAFSHYADPASMRSDYTLTRLDDGTNVITSFNHDTYGRVTQKVMPKGNDGRTIDEHGNLDPPADPTQSAKFATNWTYYGPTDTAALPAACGGGTAVNQGELLKDVAPRGVATTIYVYDRAGRAIATTKGIGTICRTYDNEGRTTSEIAPGDVQATTYVYDPAGALRGAQNVTGTVATEYDEAGRVKRSIDSFGAEATFLYDQHGNLTRRTAAVEALSSSANHVTQYFYDDADRMTGLTDPAGRSYRFTYDSRDNLRTTQYPNGTFAWHDYNNAGWLVALYNRHGSLSSPLPTTVPVDSQSSPLVDFAYTYELEGRKVRELRTEGTSTPEATDYEYDSLGRLSRVTLPGGNVRRYVFDLDSNRLQTIENNQIVASYAYDASNPLTAGIDQLSSNTQGGQTRTFEYRPDGEMVKRGEDIISWDGWGRHVGGTFGAATVNYSFDALGFRRSRSSIGPTTQYRLTGLYETNSAGEIQLSAIDGAGGDLAQFGGPPVEASPVSYLHYNGHGDLAAMSDASGTRTGAYTYDPFGAPHQAQPSDKAVERFTGGWDKKHDTASELIEMGARPYDPELGRFLSIDPVEGGAANPYDYAMQDPLNAYDLDGQFVVFAAIIAIRAAPIVAVGVKAMRCGSQCSRAALSVGRRAAIESAKKSAGYYARVARSGGNSVRYGMQTVRIQFRASGARVSGMSPLDGEMVTGCLNSAYDSYRARHGKRGKQRTPPKEYLARAAADCLMLFRGSL